MEFQEVIFCEDLTAMAIAIYTWVTGVNKLYVTLLIGIIPPQKLTLQAGTPTMNEDVFPIEN